MPLFHIMPMNKKKYLFILFLEIILCIFTNKLAQPFLTYFYGSNLIIVKKVIISLLFISFHVSILKLFDKFLNSRYLFFKSMGMSSEHIFHYLMEDNFEKILLILGIFYILLPADNSLLLVAQMLWLLLYCFGIMKILYVFSYWKISAFISRFLICFFYVSMLFGVVKTIYFNYQNIESAQKLLFTIYKSKVIKIILKVILNPPVFFVMTTICFILFANFFMVATDHRIVEMRTKNLFCKKKWGNVIHTSENKCLYLLNRIIKEVFVCFRKKENLFSFIFLYCFYIFSAFIFRDFHKVFVIISMIHISLLSLGMECFYHADTKCRRWYVLLGEPFQKFFWYKVYLSFLIVGGIFFIGYLRVSGISVGQLGLLFYFFGSVFYWNLYYCSYYTKMGERENMAEIMRFFVIWFLFYIPFVNILLCVYWYKKGKKEWDKID